MMLYGLVAEYNPFHFGHEGLIFELHRRGATHIAVSMSGSFTQRGEPALLSKWERARMALSGGADLVTELPAPWAVSGAERFSLGGVAALDALSCDVLACGSESGDTPALQKVAEALLSPAFSATVKQAGAGISFAVARQQAVAQLCGRPLSLLLSHPNDTLAVEYAKALRTLNSAMELQTMRRLGAGHNSAKVSGRFASAGELRRLVFAGEPWAQLMPAPAAAILQEALSKGEAPGGTGPLEIAMLSKLRQMNRADFANLPDVSGGLEDRLYAAAREAASLEAMYALAKTKCYTHARIRRAVLAAFLGLAPHHAAGTPPYLRVLGMNARGAEILKRAKAKGALPLVCNAADIAALPPRARELLELEARCTDLFALSLPKPPPCGLDWTHGIVVV